MNFADLPTPCLVLDEGILRRNVARMSAVVRGHGVALRPHLKTAKSVEVARLAVDGEAGGVTVSTMLEAEYFAAAGFRDITLAAGVTPEKLEWAGLLAANGATLTVITDDVAMAARIGAVRADLKALVEIDCGEGRGGVAPDSDALLAIATALGTKLSGVLTHAGHSYRAHTPADAAAVAEQERSAAVYAAERLRAAGLRCDIVSVGSTPTALHARHLDGVTEVRAGVYMFGDLFQAAIGSHVPENIALTVLASVIGRRPAENRILLDAGSLALSKDRSTQDSPHDALYGEVRDLHGAPSFGRVLVERAYQEHGVARGDLPLPFERLPVGAKVRVAPNHACLTAAAHSCYHIVDGSDEVTGTWSRINGW